jgi:peptide methionine sulfoxide reductase MsrA
LPPNPAIPPADRQPDLRAGQRRRHRSHRSHPRQLRPQKVSYPQLLDHFWRHIDPTVKNRQFCDIGTQYRSGIYWQNEGERQAAESSRDALLASGKVPRIETEIIAASTFYPAEEYHQDYYKKNSVRYAYYRLSVRPRCATEADLGGR